MPQKLIQTQREEQTQQLTALQVATAQILEMPIADFEERVRNEMDDNAALEESGGEEEDRSEETQAAEDEREQETEALSDELADYLSADDVPDYLLRQNNAAEERDFQISSIANQHDEFTRQIGENHLTDREKQVLEYMVGSLDDDGYLRKNLDVLCDEMNVYHNIDTNRAEVERMLSVLQTFEPHGIGARDLRECLRLQVKSPEFSKELRPYALKILDSYFDDFTTHHWKLLAQRLKIDDDTLQSVVEAMRHLNPKPGSALNETAGTSAPTIIPDFYVEVAFGDVQVRLNRGNVPDLRVGRSFRDTLLEYGKNRAKLNKAQRDEYVYAKKKVEDAETFLEIMRRRKSTLLAVMQAIARFQKTFFLEEDDETKLVPLTLKEVADAAGVDMSTVSRVNNSKYAQTDYGIYPLRFFYSHQFTASDGEELSSRQAHKVLAEIVAGEDKRKPLSDEAIADLMKERGMPISRRTVAKYRTQMGIPKSIHRISMN